MSSATRPNIGAAGKAAAEIVQDQSAPNMGLSPRQLELDHLWRYYRCANYENRRVDWNGQERLGKIEHEIVATSGFMPAGFYDAGQTLPLKFRKPTAPYYLGRVIVDRFTSLLFSAKRHPKIQCVGDPLTEDWLSAFVEESRLWAQMLQARKYGGAMGSVAIGFVVTNGKPKIEVHDPRWCTPTFFDRGEMILSSFEKRYQFKEDERDEEGKWREVWYWYRRVIDDKSDIVWPKVKVEQSIEPSWARERSLRAEHNYGFVPVVWLQNTPVEDDCDGDSDCHGIYEMIEGIDQLYAQAHRGTISNCDPTLTISSEADWENGVKKGSGSALIMEKGGSAQYLEMTGSGPKMAVELAERLEEKTLTVARCMLDRNEGGPSRTAEEVEHNYSSMIEQADVLREQYGEKGVKRFLEQVLSAARAIGRSRREVDAAGVTRIVRDVIKLPPKRELDPETGKITITERQLGDTETINLIWPNYFEVGGQTILSSVQAASAALIGGLVDEEHAARYVAEYFQVEDVRAMLDGMAAKKRIEQEALQTQFTPTDEGY